MLRLWKWYNTCLAVHPVKTQVISSGILWGFGDVGAQTVARWTMPHESQTKEKNKGIKIDWRRVATTSMFGFAFLGPVGHYWYEYLDHVVRIRYQLHPKSFKFVAVKILADAILTGPLDLLIFFSYMGFAYGKSIKQVKEEVKRDFFPALPVDLAVWPIVQFANFRYIPVRQQLLYVNLVYLLESCFLSWIEQQGDAPWKQWFRSFYAFENQKSQPDV
ncbi:protein Mpv17 [Canna indica]|uniref:Protein Mpv17 n=1 Tax=Canna indica TaxID=4628 RepID=A0AAQ3JRE2_9LILI|nr:protein Mpv17 [Canna indica]